ncbi:MAG: Hsp20/alpha crystallin family protein [Bdellovibrionota bacterium]
MANLPVTRSDSFFSNRQSPFRAMARMQREMDKMFENFWSGDLSMSLPEIPSFQAPYNVREEGSHYLLSFDVPGFSKEDIKVELDNDQLHVYAEHSEEREEKKGKRYESSYGALDHWLTLPANAKGDAIEAKIENGVLQIALPKTEASRAKQIPVGEGKTGFFAKLLPKKDKAA